MSRAQLRPLILLALVSGGAPAAVGQTSTVVDVLEGNAALFSNRLVIAQGVATGVFSFAHGTNTVAGAPYSIALGAGARAMHANSFVWSDGMSLQTATSRQFIVHATNGIFLLGGPIVGNAIGLTNVAASGIVGLGSAAWSAAGDFASAAQGDLADTSLQSSGGVSWAAAQNAGGQQLTNLAAAFSTGIGSVTSVVTNAVLSGLQVSVYSNPYNASTPPEGMYYGDPTNGYFGPASFTAEYPYDWVFSWTGNEYDYVGSSLDCYFYCSYHATWVSSSVISYDENQNPTAVTLYCMYEDIDGTYYGDIYSGFYGGPGGNSIIPGSYGDWYLCHGVPQSDALSTSYDGASNGDYPVSGDLGEYWMSFSTYYEDVPGEIVTPVTNIVPFEVADGRFAWMGTHDAGGFALTNLSSLAAASLSGDGSSLFNIGSAAILNGTITFADFDATVQDSLDGRYVVKEGNSTVVGDIEVTGVLTRNGQTIESVNYLTPRGDIPMGAFTVSNAPPQP